MAELLLAAKADVNAKDSDGWTPLHWAADRGRADVAELLLANNANVDAKAAETENTTIQAAGSESDPRAESLRNSCGIADDRK
jgi:ankyrin repeat protein